jgi:hypothetical protein
MYDFERHGKGAKGEGTRVARERELRDLGVGHGLGEAHERLKQVGVLALVFQAETLDDEQRDVVLHLLRSGSVRLLLLLLLLLQLAVGMVSPRMRVALTGNTNPDAADSNVRGRERGAACAGLKRRLVRSSAGPAAFHVGR